jgi:hypothetical protein
VFAAADLCQRAPGASRAASAASPTTETLRAARRFVSPSLALANCLEVEQIRAALSVKKLTVLAKKIGQRLARGTCCLHTCKWGSMRKPSVGVFLALALAVSGPANAAGSFTGSLTQVWAGDNNVRNLGWIALAGALSTPACGNTTYLWLDLNDSIAKVHFFATALAALTAGKSVTIYSDGNGSCNGSYERVRGVIVDQ